MNSSKTTTFTKFFEEIEGRMHFGSRDGCLVPSKPGDIQFMFKQKGVDSDPGYVDLGQTGFSKDELAVLVARIANDMLDSVNQQKADLVRFG